MGGAFDAFFGAFTLDGLAVLRDWLGFVHLETLAFIIGTSIFTVAMARERNEMVAKIAANTDALTGVSTRRAFYDQGESILADQPSSRTRRWRSFCSTSTPSRRSTTPSVMARATKC